MRYAKGKHFSYRPALEFEAQLNELSEATGAPKTFYLDRALKVMMPVFMEEHRERLNIFRVEKQMREHQVRQTLALNDRPNMNNETPNSTLTDAQKLVAIAEQIVDEKLSSQKSAAATTADAFDEFASSAQKPKSSPKQ